MFTERNPTESNPVLLLGYGPESLHPSYSLIINSKGRLPRPLPVVLTFV